MLQKHSHARPMKRPLWIVGACAAASALIVVSVVPPSKYLLWNRTESAPKGLYWRKNSPFTRSGWAVLSANAPAAEWVSNRGYLARGWPIIKRVRGLSGDEICRTGLRVTINSEAVANALQADSNGQSMPVWEGCFVLKEDETFLLNDHPRSLDGRYFGPTKIRDLDGSAVLIWKSER